MSAQAPTRHRTTWRAEHHLPDPYVPEAAPLPDTAPRDWERATKVWFIAATSVAAVFLAIGSVLIGAAVLR